jgi:hypothetical protein
LHVKLAQSPSPPPKAILPEDIAMATVQVVAALAAIMAGVWEYFSGLKDYR